MPICMALALDVNLELPGVRPVYADPLGFLAGKRFVCYCGRSVVGSTMCRECAEEMAEYFSSARRRSAQPPPHGG